MEQNNWKSVWNKRDDLLDDIDMKDTKLARVLGDTDMFAENLEKLGSKVAKDIVKTYKNLVNDNYKGFNQITKIAVGVFITIPITCTALNWVYPRFMDLCFPGLAGRKKGEQKVEKPEVGEGGNK